MSATQSRKPAFVEVLIELRSLDGTAVRLIARTVVLSKNCTKCAVSLRSTSSWKNASNTPDRLSRQNRFQMLFQVTKPLRQRTPR
jgi:hypothetical protein